MTVQSPVPTYRSANQVPHVDIHATIGPDVYLVGGAIGSLFIFFLLWLRRRRLFKGSMCYFRGEGRIAEVQILREGSEIET